MIDLEEWRGEAASISDSPDESVEFCIERTSRTATRIKIVSAETDDGAEGLFPGKVQEIDRNFGIGCEDGAGGTRGVLILIDLEGATEARAVVAEVPAGIVVKSGARERASAEDEEIAATVEKVGNAGESCLRNHGGLREDEEAGLRFGQGSDELIGGKDAGVRKNLGKLRGRSGSAVRGGKAGFGPDDGVRIILSLERLGNEKKQEQGRGR